MSIASHQASLRAKHETLDTQIQEELLRPLPNSVHIQSLKKKKLEVKQAIGNA